MTVSVFDLFRVGIGPSSSHTVGPMRAARAFAAGLDDLHRLDRVKRVRVELFGSLGATGPGHGTPAAVMLGLEGECPEAVDVGATPERLAAIRGAGQICLSRRHPVPFSETRDLLLLPTQVLAHHPNGMRFGAFDGDGQPLDERVYYSVGGGFVVEDDGDGVPVPLPADECNQSGDAAAAGEPPSGRAGPASSGPLPYPFQTAAELLGHCKVTGRRISAIMLANERTWRTDEQIHDQLLGRWRTMQACIRRGCRATGTMPGRLHVARRASRMHAQLEALNDKDDPLRVLDWVTLFALAVNEENAAGGRVVTAPTNGAAGVIPAVGEYYLQFVPGSDSDYGICRYLLTAGAIGSIYKETASISGAEVGCQGEVGAACSMAAGGLCEVLGGTAEQVENAAEIAMEHNLGLTCDPVAGLVQIPCIERNAMAAVKAITAARMALQGDGRHLVSLDSVIETMRQTGADMHDKYKETSLGGLAVNVVEC